VWTEIDDSKVKISFLIEHGADVNNPTSGGILQMAVYRCSLALVCLLIDKGADVNERGGKYGSPLQAVAYREVEHERADIFRMLLARGAHVNGSSTNGYGHAIQGVSRWRNKEKPIEYSSGTCFPSVTLLSSAVINITLLLSVFHAENPSLTQKSDSRFRLG
jgi:ankyrin repeat protein